MTHTLCSTIYASICLQIKNWPEEKKKLTSDSVANGVDDKVLSPPL